MDAALDVRGLTVRIAGRDVVTDATFALPAGRRTGLIGESGSGKTMTALAVMGLLPDVASATGEVRFAGEDLLGLTERRLCRLRGDRLAMVFQEPATALNPVMRVGDQVAETFRVHRGLGRHDAEERALELLERVRMPDPAARLRAYPHQLSGGQRQRVMIAIAMACSPALVLADEPTTALDVTVQAQVLDLLSRLVDEERSTLLLITHDLPVVSQLCDAVLVMYGGRIVERGPVAAAFGSPRHPYTAGLIQTIPPLDQELPGRRFLAIPGSVPALGEFPSGCPFRSRCARADAQCAEMPPLEGGEHAVACWHPVS